MQIDLSSYTIVLVNPAIAVSTAAAFSGIQPSIPSKSVASIIHQPVETWKNELTNDFEIPVFKQYPEIKEIRDHLYNKGAIYASMSGSGSTVYGIFKNKNPSLSFPAHYLTKELPGKRY